VGSAPAQTSASAPGADVGVGQASSPAASPSSAVKPGVDDESPGQGTTSASRSKRRHTAKTGKSSWAHTLEHPFHEGGPDLRRHVGFSWRVGAGLGFGTARRKLVQGSSTVDGIAGSLHIDVGATVIENLVVYGRLEGFGFNHLPSRDTNDTGNAYFGLIGAGARYYFMPLDWYAGGTLSLAGVLVTSDHGASEKAHPGFGVSLEGGKNWWVGARRDLRAIGLGLRASYVWASPAGKSSKDDNAWMGLALCLVFSVAYN